MKRLVLFNVVFVLFISNASGADLSANITRHRAIESLLCHQSTSFKEVLKKNNFHLPNGLSTISGKPLGGSDLIQPRMLQFVLNIWRMMPRIEGDHSLPCREILISLSEIAQEAYLRYSNNFLEPIPWKRHFNHKVNIEHHMDIYDVADWLTISATYHNAFIQGASDAESSHYLYLKSVESILRSMLTKNHGRIYQNKKGALLPTAMKIPVGHITLSVDALMMTDLAVKRSDNKAITREILSELVEAALKSNLMEDERGFSDTTLMTYGEIFESVNLYRKVYSDEEFYLFAMSSLVESVVTDFALDGKLFYYHRTNRDRVGCYHVMSLEGFYTNLLKFALYSDDPQLLQFGIDNINQTLNALGSPPLIETCGEIRSTHIAGYYAVTKLLSFMETEGLLVEPLGSKGIEAEILDYILEKLRAKLLIKSKANSKYIEDISPNVWIYNEYIVPRYFSDKYQDIQINDFYGCNFLYIRTGSELAY